MFPTCLKRTVVQILNRTGSVGETHRCTHQSCASFTQAVTPEICSQCPLRQEINVAATELQITERDFQQPIIDSKGLIIYPRTGYEPPVVPLGYKRLDDNIRSPGAWMFVPQWPDCKDRTMANTVRPCGCLQINALCVSDDSGKKGENISPKDCVNCPVRRAT